MAVDFVARTGGSKWVQAQSARQRTNFGGGLGEREAKRSLPQLETALPIKKPPAEDSGRRRM